LKSAVGTRRNSKNSNGKKWALIIAVMISFGISMHLNMTLANFFMLCVDIYLNKIMSMQAVVTEELHKKLHTTYKICMHVCDKCSKFANKAFGIMKVIG